MPLEVDHEQRIRQTARSAQSACLCFGLGLLVWGLAPAVIARLATGQVPPLQMFAVSSVCFALGVAFLVLALLMGRGVAWAFWTSLSLSLVLMAGNIGFALIHKNALFSAFALLLPACTAGTTWLALEARRAARRVKPTSTAA